MQDALESIFGPAAGLIGFAVLIVLFLPKVIVWWRGVRARRREAHSTHRPRILGCRSLHLPVSPEAVSVPVHPTYGEAIMRLECAKLHIFGMFFLSCLPIGIASLIPEGHYSLRLLFLLIGIPLVLLGIYSLLNLGNHVIFYRTGMEARLAWRRFGADYNTIVSFRQHHSSMLLRLDDDRLITLNGIHYRDGVQRIKSAFDHLGERTMMNAAEAQKWKEYEV